MSVFGNRAKETSQSAGDAGVVNLDGPSAGFQSLTDEAKAISGDGTGPWTVSFFRIGGNEWECGTATLTEGLPDTLTYDIPLEASSNAGSRVDWGVGTTTIFLWPLASQVYALLGKLTTTGLIKRTGADTYAIATLDAWAESNLLTLASAAAARTLLDAQEDVITTRGDVLRGSSGGSAERLALGSAGSVYSSDGSDAVFQSLETLRSYVPLPRGYIGGLELANDVDADHDIEISPGACRDSSDAVNLFLSAAMTKQLDSPWAAGDDAGGLFSGPAAANTVYHVFLIQKDSDGSIDAGFDTDPDAANIPGGYTKYRRIGSRRTQAAAANWRPMIQFGDHCFYDPAATSLDISDTGDSTSGTTVAIDVPTGFRVIALLRVQSENVNSGDMVIIECPDVVNEAPGDESAPLASLAEAGNPSREVQVLTNTSGQIRYRAEKTTTDFFALTRGWIDHRGRYD